MFTPCTPGFIPGTLVSLHRPKTYGVRQIKEIELSMNVFVVTFVSSVCDSET